MTHREVGEVDLEASGSTIQAKISAIKAVDQSDLFPEVLPSHIENAAGHAHIQVSDKDSAPMSPCAAATEACSSRALCDVQSKHQQADLVVSGLLEKEGSSASTSCQDTGRSHSVAATTALDFHHCILEFCQVEDITKKLMKIYFVLLPHRQEQPPYHSLTPHTSSSSLYVLSIY